MGAKNIGFIHGRSRARGIIEAIEKQRDGREAAFEDIPKYAVMGWKEITLRLVISLAAAWLYGAALPESVMPRAFIIVASAVAFCCGWFLFKKDYRYVFYTQRRLRTLSSCLTRMRRRNDSITIALESQKEMRQRYEDLRPEIEDRLNGTLEYCTNYGATDPKQISHYEITLLAPAGSAAQICISDLELTEDDLSLAVNILTALAPEEKRQKYRQRKLL